LACLRSLSTAFTPHARYDVWGFQGTNQNWRFWAGLNQNNVSGWIYLGDHGMGSNNTILVTLNNHAPSAGWELGAGAMAFECV
jgi:hypothetical protein